VSRVLKIKSNKRLRSLSKELRTFEIILESKNLKFLTVLKDRDVHQPLNLFTQIGSFKIYRNYRGGLARELPIRREALADVKDYGISFFVTSLLVPV
jgi:hypothetical protein